MMHSRSSGKRTSHDNTERWLLTYADLITLLLGLFVILYTMSKVDNDKYSKVMQALGGIFGSASSASVGTSEMGIQESGGVADKIRGAMYEDLKSNMISVSQDRRGVVVHLTEELLFASGSAELKRTSSGSLDLLAGVLNTLPNDIRVEGHTDNIPIKTVTFPSNWHLSVARAMNTAEYLMARRGLPPGKVSVVGYSEYRPLEPNTSEQARAKNRRVDIVIISSESAQSSQQ